MKNVKKEFVNWSDGMNINKTHFVGMENALLDEIRDANQVLINDYNYGLLPIGDSTSSIDLSLTVDITNTLTVQVKKCYAIAESGARVSIGNNIVGLSADFKIEDDTKKKQYIVLSIQLFEREAFGEADPKENPPRLPFAKPVYQIHLVPERDLEKVNLGTNYLIIGHVHVNGNSVAVSKKYIPPCTTIQSHISLVEFYESHLRFSSNLEISCIEIIQKIYLQEQKNSLESVIFHLSEELLRYISANSAAMKSTLFHQPPIFSINSCLSFAKIINNVLHIRKSTGRQELLDFLSNDFGIKSSVFEQTINNLIGHSYEHLNCQKSLDLCNEFSIMIDSIFQKLAELNYIGRNSKSNLFLKEENMLEKRENPPSWKGKFLAE